MAGAIKELNDANFDATVGNGLVLVDFWAPWCGPCRMQGPILEQLAAEMGTDLTISKVNVDEAGVVASRFGIRSIPTLILFQNGKAVQQWVGVQAAPALKAAVERFITR